MNSIAAWAGATGLVMVAAICPQKSAAEGFTGSAFLQWNDAEKRGFIDAQLVMASSIVSRSKPAMSRCMADQYYGDSGLTDAGYEAFIEAIGQFEDFHPSSVLIVVIENECGAFY